ncbi:MAG: thioesterase [Bacteroidales bacterium]|nr:thioesterase [Bacteroidales bacterium]
MDKLVQEKSYRVSSYEADASGSLGIPGLFNYLQDTASAHASVLGFGKDDLERNNMFWVLSRILVKMDTIPGWEEEITIKTWPRGPEGIFAIRDFEVYAKDGKKYGAATSSWLMVGRESRRPLRPDRILKKMDGRFSEERALGRVPGKLPEIKDISYRSPSLTVKYSDLDVNMHVNNVHYIRWALDSYPLEYRLNNVFESAEINYLHESLPGDEIRILAAQKEENIFDHSVIRDNDHSELCRLRIRWKR